MKFSVYQDSRTGGRKYNQDRVGYSYSRDALLLVLADGMGGHLHGEVAAQIAVELVTDQFQKKSPTRFIQPVAVFLTDAFFCARMKPFITMRPIINWWKSPAPPAWLV